MQTHRVVPVLIKICKMCVSSWSRILIEHRITYRVLLEAAIFTEKEIRSPFRAEYLQGPNWCLRAWS